MKSTLFLLAVLGLVVYVTWDQPLKYQFMSAEEIEKANNPPSKAVATSAPRAPFWSAPGYKTALDQLNPQTASQHR